MRPQPASDHRGQRPADASERRGQVEVEHPLPVLVASCRTSGRRHTGAGVGDQHLDGTPFSSTVAKAASTLAGSVTSAGTTERRPGADRAATSASLRRRWPTSATRWPAPTAARATARPTPSTRSGDQAHRQVPSSRGHGSHHQRPFHSGGRLALKAAWNSAWSSVVISSAWVIASSSTAGRSDMSSSRVISDLVWA